MGQNTFPTSLLELSPLQDPETPSILDIRPFITQLKGRDADSLSGALTQVQQAFDLIQDVLRSTPPSLKYLSIDSADIGVLAVGSQFGPGVATVQNGLPNFDTIGWIGSQPSASAVAVTSIVAGLVTTGAVHKLKAGDNVFIDGTTDLNNIGFYVVATTPLTTTYTVTGGVAGGNSTGGTSTKQFQGIWVKSGAIGGTAFDNAKLIADVDGSLSITDAKIVVTGSGAKITIDPVIGQIIIDGTAGSGVVSTFDSSGLLMAAGSLSALLNPTDLTVGAPAFGQGYFVFHSAGGGGSTLTVFSATGGGSNYMDLDNTANLSVTGNINTSGVFKKGGTSGESVTLTYLTGTPGVGQSSKTVTFSGGIETSHT